MTSTEVVEVLENSCLKGYHRYRRGREGDTFTCLREPQNKYSGVSILAKLDRNGLDVGHIPNHLSRRLAPLLDTGNYVITGTITGPMRDAPGGRYERGGGQELPCDYLVSRKKKHLATCNATGARVLQEQNGRTRYQAAKVEKFTHSIAASLQTVQQKRQLNLHLLHLILHGLPSTGKTCAKLRLIGQTEELHKRKPAMLSDSGQVFYSKDDGSQSTLLADDIVRARIPAADTAVASKDMDQPWYLLPLPEELVLMATKMENTLVSKPKEEELSAKGPQSSLGKLLPARMASRKIVPTLKDFKRIVTTAFNKASHTDLQHLLSETLLYLIDSGGQPQFQELLPTLISGPSLFLLTFSLAVGLDAEFQVAFTDPNSRQEYPTSMKVSDALLQCLASICCTCSYQTNGVNAVEVKPRVIFMATMKSLVTESKIDEIDEKLHSLLAPYKDEDIIVYNTRMSKVRKSCLFPIDSFTDDGIPALRQAVKEVANSSVIKVITGEPPRRQRLCEVPLPAPTVALELVLRFQSNEKNIITLDECTRIARDCNINDADLPNVLWHLHHFTGSIRYYPEHDRLRNYVVTRPQALYDIPSTLLTDTFAFSKNVECYKSVKDMVWTRGVFTMDDLRRLWNKDQDISPDLIIDFLLHLNIIARIQDKKKEKFFMPCALVCAAPENNSKRLVQKDSMLMCFECMYTPKGAYSSLLACLLNKGPENVAKEKPDRDSIGLEWALPTFKGSLCSNQAMLRVKVDDDELDFIVKLTIHHKFIEVNVSYDDDEPVPPTKMLQYYMAILDHIQHTVKTVIKDLHYNSNAELCDGLFFPCFCDHEVDTHAVKYEKRKGYCQGLKVKPSESWVRKWIKVTTTSVDQPQPSVSQPPPPVATENTMSVVDDSTSEQTTPAAKKPNSVQDTITTDSQSTTCAGKKRPSVADAGTALSLTTPSAAKKARSDPAGPSTAIDSQTTPSPPAPKKQCSLLEVNADNVLFMLQKHNFPNRKWKEVAMGLQLGGIVDDINFDHHDASSKLIALINHWVRNDADKSWEKLVSAMKMSAENIVANNLAHDVGIQ